MSRGLGRPRPIESMSEPADACGVQQPTSQGRARAMALVRTLASVSSRKALCIGFARRPLLPTRDRLNPYDNAPEAGGCEDTY